MATYLPTQDVLNVEVSCFANYDTPSNPKPIKIYSWLTTAKYRAKVEAIRAESEKAKRDTIKATLPAITPSGLFTYRRTKDLVKHSGLIQFDIDLKDNPRIRNYADLKSQLCKLPFVAYCGLSVSGTGYWGLVPIAQPERHSQHFDALNRVFTHYGIKLDDKPRNVASLRGYSYDPDGYIASQVMLFELYDEPRPQPARTFDYSRFRDEDDSELLTRLVRYTEKAGEGNRHETLLKASKLAGGFVAAGRLDEQTALYALETVASEWPMFTKSQKTIRDGIRYGLTAPIYAEERTEPLKIISKASRPPTYKKPAEADVQSTPVPEELPIRIQDVVTEQPQPSVPLIVKTIADQLANPGSILRPDESQLERLVVEPADSDYYYPAEVVGQPKVPSAGQKSTAAFFAWQRSPESPFSQLGLASLQTPLQS